MIIYSLRATPVPSLVLIKWRGQKILTLWFDLDLWTYDLKINRDHSTHWGKPLHQVWYWSSKGVKRYWPDKTWSTDRQTERHTDRPTDSCKTICPLFQGGHKNTKEFSSFSLFNTALFFFTINKPLVSCSNLFHPVLQLLVNILKTFQNPYIEHNPKMTSIYKPTGAVQHWWAPRFGSGDTPLASRMSWSWTLTPVSFSIFCWSVDIE